MMRTHERQIDEAVYDHFVHAGGAPDPVELAVRLKVAESDLAASYRRLAEQLALVLDADGAIGERGGEAREARESRYRQALTSSRRREAPLTLLTPSFPTAQRSP